MAEPVELLEIARKLERKADADDILGDPVPVQRSLLSDAVRVLRKAYTELQTAPPPEELAAQEIADLRRLCRWFVAAMDLDDEELTRNLPPELLPSAAWLWAPPAEAEEPQA